MARKYDWEAHLTEREKTQMERWGRLLVSAKSEYERLQNNRDRLRRECVQRARTAFNRKCRALTAGMGDSK